MDIEQLEDDAVDEELKDEVRQNGYFSNRWLMYCDNRAPLFGCTVFIVGTENPRKQELDDKLVALGAEIETKPWKMWWCTHVVAAVLDESRTPDNMNKLFVVKPEWVDACFERKERVAEAEFEHFKTQA